jgi:hypothetical protein
VAISVADRSSNKNEQLVHAGEVIGRSDQRAKVFREIYRGKSKVKTVTQLMKATKLGRIRVLDQGKKLSDNELVIQTKVDGETAYEKVAFIQPYRDKILNYATDRKVREAVPTKRRFSSSASVRLNVDVKVPATRVRAKLVTVDDIDSFSGVRKIRSVLAAVKMPEARFKDGVARILGERGTFKDWGGEIRDLSSTRLKIGGKRRAAAFAFKGPGTSGRLTPRKLGKNGDQIQRLARCPAEVFLVQYWNEMDDSVLEQLEKFVQLKAYLERRTLWYGVIDGQDSARLIAAYASRFK